MERKAGKLIIMLVLFLLHENVHAGYRTDIYNAYITGKMDQWKNVIDRMEMVKNKSNEFVLELINYEYGYIGYCIGIEKQEDARKYLSLAEKNVSLLEKAKYRQAFLNAYRSAFYGYRISFSKLSAPVNGPKSLNHAKKSIELDKQNYLGYIQLGNAYFYMPAAFGGSKQVALENFSKARTIMEKDPELTRENWNYLSLLVTIAQSYSSLGDHEKARKEYENILSIEPGFLYVRNDLYPKLLSKIKQQK